MPARSSSLATRALWPACASSEIGAIASITAWAATGVLSWIGQTIPQCDAPCCLRGLFNAFRQTWIEVHVIVDPHQRFRHASLVRHPAVVAGMWVRHFGRGAEREGDREAAFLGGSRYGRVECKRHSTGQSAKVSHVVSFRTSS